jgi:hypothetical protein
MSQICHELHQLFHQLERYTFPFDETKIPLNGIYVLFEKGEYGHSGQRIVRVGTHTGDNQLRSRLKQHFVRENKDRSIFRKNIGRALLNRRQDPFLEWWEKDLTSSKAKKQYRDIIDFETQSRIETEVTVCIQENFSFVAFQVQDKQQRLGLEKKIISTVSWCDECKPSSDWLGLTSPKAKIRQSGLWLVNELYKEPFTRAEFSVLCELL